MTCLRRCCCCCTLPVGAIVIGTLDIVFSLIGVAMLSLVIHNPPLFFPYQPETEKRFNHVKGTTEEIQKPVDLDRVIEWLNGVKSVAILYETSFLIQLVCSVLLIVAIILEPSTGIISSPCRSLPSKRRMLLPWLVDKMIQIVAAVAVVVFVFTAEPFSKKSMELLMPLILLHFPFAVINLYTWFPVLGVYRELCEEEMHSDQRRLMQKPSD